MDYYLMKLMKPIKDMELLKELNLVYTNRCMLHLCNKIYKNVFGNNYKCVNIYTKNLKVLKEGDYVLPNYMFFKEIFKEKNIKYLPVLEKEGFILRNKDYNDILIILYYIDRKWFSDQCLYNLLDKMLSEEVIGLYFPVFLINKKGLNIRWFFEALSNENVKKSLQQKNIHIVCIPNKRCMKYSMNIAKTLDKKLQLLSVYRFSETYSDVLYYKLY